MQEASHESADWARLTCLAYVHHRAGRNRESGEALKELEDRFAVEAPYQIAVIHSTRGDADAAFQWLDRALLERDPGIPQAYMEPVFRPLHSDPRWGQLLRKLHIE
jgi:hypothetical protein